MTTELEMMIYSLGVLALIIVAQALAGIKANGLEAMAGARDNLPASSVLHGRATRLRANMIENLMIFVPLVITAHLLGISTEYTVLGTQLFVFSRIAHAVIYLAGWPWVRPIAFFASLLGMGMVLFALF